MIQPTVGRVLHYHPDESENLTTIGTDPLLCLIAGVVDENHVNLVVFDSNGRCQESRLNVPIIQGDLEPKAGVSFCTWMPFQKGQAAKNDDLTPRIAALEEQVRVLAAAAGNPAPADSTPEGS